MSAEKTEAVTLSVAPYRETSCILRLFTRTRGLVHGIAKGVRRGGKSSVPLDRGFLLEMQLYYRPNRELHTLGGLHVVEFFPGIRSDITKSAIRDVALELYLKSITQSEPHPELFELMTAFLAEMEGAPPSPPKNLFPPLWRLIRTYCHLMGFGADAEDGGRYGAAADINAVDGTGADGGYLRVTERLLQYCRRHLDIRTPFNALDFLKSDMD